MAEPTPKAPANKKAGDDAVRDFVADSETGVIAPEVADAFDLGKTTARERLSRLEDCDEIASRKASAIRLFYVPADDREHGTNDEGDTPSEPTPETDDSESDTGRLEDVFGSVEFLTDAQIEYLRDGTLSEYVEPHVLDRLAERFVETVWEIPYDDGPDREEMKLVARRLSLSLAEIASLTPSEVVSRIDDRADAFREDVDQLYLPHYVPHEPSMETLRKIRQHTLFTTQTEVVERLAEIIDWQPTTCQTSLSTWETKGIDPGEDVRKKLASIYRDIYEEDHDPYRNREEWDWPGTNDAQTGETSDSTGCSSESDPDSETDLAPAVRRLDQSQRMSEDHDDE